MGDLGTRFDYTGVPLSGLYSSPDGTVTAIHIREGFDGATEGGVGIGVAREAVTAEFGEALTDPVLGMLWYPHAGIAFQIVDDEVSRIQIFAPVP